MRGRTDAARPQRAGAGKAPVGVAHYHAEADEMSAQMDRMMNAAHSRDTEIARAARRITREVAALVAHGVSENEAMGAAIRGECSEGVDALAVTA